jgi:hypothetical protein
LWRKEESDEWYREVVAIYRVRSTLSQGANSTELREYFKEIALAITND